MSDPLPIGEAARPSRNVARAIRLTKAGWCAFAVLGGPGRKPLVRGYLGGRPFPLPIVQSMRWGIAADVGISLPPHLLALDVDVKDERRGTEQLHALSALHEPLPTTLQQTTRSGGQHLVFDVSALPLGSRFRGNVRSPVGGRSGIDVVTSRHRYLVVYDDAAFLAGDRVIAPLPESWWPVVLLEASPGRKDSSRRGSGALLGAEEHLSAVATALPGSRNQTLNDHAFELAVWGRLDDDKCHRLAEAASKAGLDPSEIDATLDSARQAGRRIRHTADRWLVDVEGDPVIHARRSGVGVLAAARHVADHAAAVTGYRPVGMAARTLAEALGVTADTASRYLRLLVDRGWLNREAPLASGQAHTYALTHPRRRAPTSDNHPFPPPTQLLHTDTGSTSSSGAADARGPSRNAQRAIDMRLGQLLDHRAFRVGTGPRLARNAGRLLVAMEAGPATTDELKERAGMPATSFRRAIRQLLEGGLARSDAATGLMEISGNDVLDTLDTWAESHHIGDREAMQRTHHEAQRQQFAERERRKSSFIAGRAAFGRPSPNAEASRTPHRTAPQKPNVT